MSADKYAQFIAEQQKKLSVSGTNPVNISESKDEKHAYNQGRSRSLMKDKGADKPYDDDKLNAAYEKGKKHYKETKDENDDGWYAHKEIHGKDAVSKEDWKKGIRKKVAKEEIEVEESKDATKEVSKMLADKGKTLVRNKTGLAVLRNVKPKKTVKEEEELLDEVLDTPGKRLKYALKAAGSKVKARVTGDTKTADKRTSGLKMAGKKAHAAVEKSKRDDYYNDLARAELKKMAHKTGYGALYDKMGIYKEEYELTTEEAQYIEEMVGKGKLNDILMHHKDNMRHHAKMMDHHRKMADASEDVGDKEGFEHHVERGMEHEYQHNHHQARFDHAAGLKAHANAQREMKAAKSALSAAQKKIADAKYDKKDWA